MNDRFEQVLSDDYDRDRQLLPIMQDPRIGQAVLAEVMPQLGLNVDVESVISEVARELNFPEPDVREAFERAKLKFSREAEHGY